MNEMKKRQTKKPTKRTRITCKNHDMLVVDGVCVCVGLMKIIMYSTFIAKSNKIPSNMYMVR